MVTYQEEIVFAPSEDQRWLAGVLMRPNVQARRPVRPPNKTEQEAAL